MEDRKEKKEPAEKKDEPEVSEEQINEASGGIAHPDPSQVVERVIGRKKS